ncbi:unnamed protein product [Callosobruchus maculatus]|uniref:Macro domain-containing protein n=1 Tax=Callosobruchus maculatus TaxID=64391 RepID=A0A653DWJ0_CALMS|nr:unnamed protein product [Callosobruchus maculatus]
MSTRWLIVSQETSGCPEGLPGIPTSVWPVDELKRQGGRVGQVLELRSDQRRLYYLISKEKSYQKPTYRTVWEALLDLREKLLTANVLKLAIPRLACGRDGLDWRIIRNMLEVLFRFTGIEILVCSWNPRGPTEHRTVDCFFTKLLAARGRTVSIQT